LKSGKLRIVTRIAAALLGLVAAAPALLIAFEVFLDSFKWGFPRPIWKAVKFFTPPFILTALFVALAYLLLRYALLTSHSKTVSRARSETLFRSLAVACTTVVLLLIAAELCFAVIETIRIRKYFPKGPRPGFNFDWISLWHQNANSPVFWIFVWLAFISAFYWEYCRSARPHNSADMRRRLRFWRS
jgi:hypothetical protein